jgi:multidrug efflux pump subunit AcrB
VGAFLAVAMIILISGVLKVSFFASDPERFLYVNAELPRSSSLQNTLRVTSKVENEVIKLIRPEDIRGSISYSGQQFTDVGMSHGEYLGQVFVSLNPLSSGAGSVHDIVNTINNSLEKNIEGAEITVVTLEGGPPLGSPVNVKVRGDDFESIQAVTDKLRAYMVEQGLFSNISIDFKLGNPEMRLSLNGDAIKRAGLSPALVTRSLQSFVDGNLISQYQYLGEEVDVRLLASSKHPGVDSLLQQTIAIKDGAPIALSELVNVEYGYGYDNILHHNFQRAVTLSADIDTELTDTVTANKMVSEYWSSIQSEYPKVNLDYSGELDEIQDSLNGMVTLFVMGLGLIYLILGTQFKSYLQPFLVLVSVPLAFSGVVFGLTLTNNPLSLYSLYGVVALSGISVNTAIVLISAANDRLELGMSLLHATIYAARRRVIPVLITSLTTIAGLFSLAAGFAGKSLVWGPVATSIVSGMIFSTVLILFIVPLLYHSAARFSKRFK